MQVHCNFGTPRPTPPSRSTRLQRAIGIDVEVAGSGRRCLGGCVATFVVLHSGPLVALCRETLMQLVQHGSSALAGLPRRLRLVVSVTFLLGETCCSKASVNWFKSAMLPVGRRKVVSSRLSSASTNHDTPTWHNKPSTRSLLSLCHYR
jgi:hypothetical protein